MGEVICPFCYDELQEYSTVCELCCYKQNVINDNGKIVMVKIVVK